MLYGAVALSDENPVPEVVGQMEHYSAPMVEAANATMEALEAEFRSTLGVARHISGG